MQKTNDDIQKIVLDRTKIAVLNYIPESVLTDAAAIESMTDYFSDNLAFRLSTYLYRQRIASWQERYVIPTNWWQHLKMQLGLNYKSKLQGIREITRYRTYPNAQIALPTKDWGVSYNQEETVWKWIPRDDEAE